MLKLNEYINSGILEAYCMGGVSDLESTKVDFLSAQSINIKKEIESIQYVLEQYACTYQLPPAASIKNKLMSKIDKMESKKGMKNIKRRRQK